ncbi:MAG: family 43 glycosylhydrolase [Thermoleophilaceae bacterium]
MRSTDLVHWDRLGPALARRPEWATSTGDWHPWAPSVLPTEEACPGASRPGCFILPWTTVVENPYVVKRGATYHLLYSGGNWQGRYAMGHATSPSPAGPFTRSSQSPWASSTDSVLSMGGGMPIRDGAGDEWLVYHGRAGSLDLPRTLRIDRLSWTADERPSLDGPSTDIRTAPTP